MTDIKKLTDFLGIAEKLECEYRLTRMSDGSPQAVASHSWNMAMMAIAVRPHLTRPVNMERVLELCILHDLPEEKTKTNQRTIRHRYDKRPVAKRTHCK